jgi:hypothetical protein
MHSKSSALSAEDERKALADPQRILAPQVPRSTELQFRPPPCGNLAIHCQEQLKALADPHSMASALKRRTTDGVEAPDSRASDTMRTKPADDPHSMASPGHRGRCGNQTGTSLSLNSN